MKNSRGIVLRNSSVRLALAAGSAAVYMIGQSASAQTWNGASATTNNWNDGTNWAGGIAPVNNGTANIIFGGNARLGPLVNIAYDVNSITFNNTSGVFTVSGAGPLTIRGGGITNNDNSNQTLLVPITVGSSQVWSASSGGLTINGANIALNAGLTVVNTTQPIQFGAPVTGPGSLTKTGTGTFSIGGVCTYSGQTTIQQGSLVPVLTNVLSGNSNFLIGAAGTLNLNGQNSTIASLSGDPGASVIISSSTFLTIGGPADVSTYTYNGAITGSGALVKNGTHTLALGGLVSNGGGITINNGTVRINASERIDNIESVSVNGGTFDVGTFTETLSGVGLVSGAITGGGQFGTGTIIADTINIQSGTLSARIGGNASIVKSNTAGNAILTGTGSTYTGATTITGGTLLTNAPDVLPDTTTVTITAPGILQLTNYSDTVAGIAGNGTITLANATLTVGSGDTSSSFAGVIGESGTPGNLTKIGAGSLTLSGVNTYRGTTTVNQGLLTLNGAERLADVSDVVVNGGQFVVQNETIGRCTLNAGEIRAFSTGNGILRASQFTLNAGYVDASLAGAGIVKAGPGTVLLAAANDQTFTRIDAGVLQAGSDAVFGGPSANISLNGGTLQLTASMILTRPFNVFSPSTLDCLGDVILTNLSPNISLGGLTKTGPGILSISGTPASAGAALNISGGSVYIGPTQSLPMINVSITDAGTLAIDGGLLRLTTSLANLGHIQLSDTARITGGSLANSGVISGSGTIASTFTNNAAGDVRIGADQSMYFNSFGATNNAGLLEVIGGMAEFEGTVTNFASTGLLFARDASLRFNAGLTNFGGIALSFGTTDIYGDINNQAGAVITISGGSDATFVDDVINNGTLRTSANGSSVFLGAVSGSGSFPGSGIVYLEGDLRPGNSPGFVSFGGDVVFGSFSSLVEELAGTNLNQYDRTAIAGTAYLDGVLDVRLYGGYIPSGIQSFTILTAGHVNGQFQSVNLPLTNPPLRVIYTDTAVLVSNCAADFNNDGVVDFFDYLDFVAAFAANLPAADFNQDSVIDFFDYLDFVQAFSAGC